MKNKKQFTSGKNIIDIYKNGSAIIIDLKEGHTLYEFHLGILLLQ